MNFNHGPSPQPTDAPETTPDAAETALRQVARLTEAVEGIERDVLDGSAVRELQVLEQVIGNLSVHTENDELLADAMTEIAALTGSQDVWIVEAEPDTALGVVHVLGELIIGDSELPADVAELCETLYQRRHQALDKIEHPLPCGATRVAMPLQVKKTLFGAIVFTTPAQAPDATATAIRDRLLSSVLRFLAVSLENRHFIDSLSDMIIETVVGFSLAIESRDSYTGGHVMRVTAYALALAKKLKLSDDDRAVLRLGGLLHDIGKVAIPDEILNKADRLTDAEYDVIQSHPSVGHEILARIPHLDRANEIVRHHHERWDGAGYPDHRAGADIPFLARILAITDSYDAMTSDRPYRHGMGHNEAMTEIRRCAGAQFDPELAEAFLTLSDQDLAAAEARMHRWMHSRNHGSELSLEQLVAMQKPMIDTGRGSGDVRSGKCTLPRRA